MGSWQNPSLAVGSIILLGGTSETVKYKEFMDILRFAGDSSSEERLSKIKFIDAKWSIKNNTMLMRRQTY